MIEGLLGGVKNFLMPDEQQMAQIDPRYGVARGDVRDAALNTLGNMSALLLAAGQPIEPAQRAQYLSQLGGAGAGFGTDIYNASQRRLMQAKMAETQDEMRETQALRAEIKTLGPEVFKQRYGIDPSGMSAGDLRQAMKQIRVANATRNPLDDDYKRGQIETNRLQNDALRRQQEQQARFAAMINGGAPAPTLDGLPPGPVPSGAPGAPPAQMPGSAPIQPPGLAPQPQQPLLQALSPDVARAMLAAGAKPAEVFEAELRAREARRKQQDEAEKGNFDRAKDLRGEFTKQTQDFVPRQTAYLTMIDLAQNKAGASDMALVLSIMKVFDPTSTVTGSEAATAQNAAGVPEAVRAQYNMIVGNGKLSDKARQDLVRAAETRFEREMDTYEQQLNRASTLAKRFKIDPEDVVSDGRDPAMRELRQFRRERDDISAKIPPGDILKIDNLDDLRKLNVERMNEAQRQSYRVRLDMLTRPTPTAPAAAPRPMGPTAPFGMMQPPMAPLELYDPTASGPRVLRPGM